MNKYLKLSLVVLVLLFALLLVKNYFSVGFLEVSVPEGSVALVKDAQDNEVLESSTSFNKKLSTGSYTVTVSSKSLASKKNVTIESRKKTSVNIKAPMMHNARPLSSVSAQNIIAGKNSVTFLDSSTGDLTKLDGLDGLSVIGSRSLIKVVWADQNYGVAQDSSGDLYITDGRDIQSFNPEVSQEFIVSYYVNPQRLIYVVYADGSVYSGKQGEPFKMVYSGEFTSASIVAGSKYFALVDSKRVGENLEVESKVSVVASGGEVLGEMTFEVGHDPNTNPSYSWSPDGERLAIAPGEGSAKVYTASLEEVYEIPGSSPRNIVWKNSDSLVYSDSGSVWSYSHSDGFAGVVHGFTADTEVYSIAAGSTEDSLFVSTSYNDKRTLYSVGPEPITDDSEELGILLPVELSGCIIKYTGYRGVFILSGSVDPLKPTQDCTPVAKNFLVQNGISLAGLSFKTTPYESLSAD